METPTVSQPPETPPTPGPPYTNAPGAGPAYTVPANGSAYPPVQSGRPYYAPYPPPSRTPPRTNNGWLIGGLVAAFALIGLLVALLVALLAGLTIGGTGMSRSNVTSRTLQVHGTPTLIIRNAAGNVHVTTGDAATVTVQSTKHIRAADDASAQRGFASIGVNIEQQGNTITVTSDFASVWLAGITQNRSVDYAITVPAGSAVRAEVSAGNIDVANTSGVLTLTSSAGNITTSNVAFAADSVLRTSAGNVIANGSLAPGGSLQVRVSAGNATIELPATTATRLDADVSVGNLTIIGFPVAVSSQGFTGHHASGDTGANPQGSVNATVSTGNLTIEAR